MATLQERRRTDQIMADYEIRVSSFALGVWKMLMADPIVRRRYFYFVPSVGSVWGSFHAVAEEDDPPAGSELVDPGPIPSGTKEQVRAWIRARTHQLPILPA